jgi:glycerol-3-phosphate acyltransferase PlsY
VDIYYTSLLSIAAFCLGACPFSVLIGKFLLHKDIRHYGDGNPGAFNVFRAGGRKAGILALVVEIGKGVPFVFLSHSVYDLAGVPVAAIGISAILGHAFSPFLKFKGGKALAVTGGVILALPLYNVFLAFMLLLFLAFLFIEVDSWIILFGTGGTLIYVITTTGYSWETFFMASVFVILAIKHFDDLRTFPTFRIKVLNLIHVRRNKN